MIKANPSPEQWQVWLKEALCLAERAAQEDEVPVGAVVVLDGKVVGRGYNRREQDQNPLAHAEIMAIEEAARTIGSWRLERCLLVVTLEPCPMCLAACQQARIPGVVYGAKDPKGGALSLGYRLHEDLRTNHRFTVNFLEHSPSSEILKTFFARMRQR